MAAAAGHDRIRREPKVGTVTAGVENRKYPLYMFDVDFDALSLPPEPEPELDSAPPPPTFSAAELAAAREEGLAAGQAEGIAQSNAGFENQIAATLDAMARTLTTLEATQRQSNDDTARAAVRLALAATAKVLPEYARRHGLAEIETFIAQSFTTLFEGVAVTVRVPEALAAEIGDRINPIAQRTGFEEGLKLIADPELGPADCRVEWDDGGAARNAAKLTAEIDVIVEQFLQQAPEPTPSIDPPPTADAAPATADSAAQSAVEEPVAVPDDLPAAELDEAPPQIVEATAEDGATVDTPEPPEIEAAADQSANPDDDNPVIETAEPAQSQTPEVEAGPVLPGAVDIDPTAT